jgi:hypothetical protein
MERLNMSKVDSGEYLKALQEAMANDDFDGLGVDDESQGEAERLAHAADPPQRRQDGEVVGGGVQRQRPLTPNQYAFVQEVIRGKSLRTAYREAFKNNSGSDQAISSNANKLMKDERIQRMLQDAWGETVEALSEDVAASKRYVLKSLLALSKEAKQGDATRLKALELMGKACGLFTPVEVQAKAVITADQLKRELASHLKMLDGARGVITDAVEVEPHPPAAPT